MNKQELIKEYENIVKDDSLELCGCYNMADKIFMRKIYKSVLEDLKQLDEPQKPVVPKYVAKWFEEHKHNLDMSICHFINSGGRIASLTEFSEFELWFGETLNPIFTLVSMLQFGYTVEKEKRYYVRFKGMTDGCNCLNYRKIIDEWFLGGESEPADYRTRHTREEIEKAGFGWVFDCPGIEIEEVKG